jgi:hypothetical protein
LTIPIGSLAFSGYDNELMRFKSPAGVDAGTPTSNPILLGFPLLRTLDDGKFCIIDGDSGSPDNFSTFTQDNQLSSILGGNATLLQSIASNYTSAFYGLKVEAGGVTTHKVWILNNVGAKTGEIDLGYAGTPWPGILGVKSDESIVYFVKTTLGVPTPDTINKRTGGVTSVFTTEVGYTCRGILVLRNNEVLVGWDKNAAGEGYVKHYSEAGALLHTYALPGTNTRPLFLVPGIDDTSFYVSYTNSALGTFTRVTVSNIEVATSTVLNTFNPDDGDDFGYDWSFEVVRVAIAGGGTPPSITCPDDIAIEANAAPITVYYPPATAISGTPPYVFTYTQNSGTAFASGVNTVTATVTDDASETANCNFDITVTVHPRSAYLCLTVSVATLVVQKVTLPPTANNGLNSVDGTNYLERAGSFDPTEDWSVGFWYKQDIDGNIIYGYGDISFINPYFILFTNGTGELIIETWDGISTIDSTIVDLDNEWHYYLLNYEKATNTLTLYQGDTDTVLVSIASVISNLGGITFIETDEFFIGDPTFSTEASGAFHRVWQELKTSVQGDIEKLSKFAVDTNNLQADTELQDPSDLSDNTGNGNDWSAVGALLTVDGPIFILFDFTVDGGLSPASFSLGDGEIQDFIDIDPGIYDVEELPKTGYLTYYNVSNGSAHDAVIVASGEIVIVTVYNQVAYSGIYKMIPNKTFDELYTSLLP